MRKFKLVKKYPACNLEIGSYIEFTGNCQQIININGNFLKSDLEKFTEFWQEVVEKDYEILEYKSIQGLHCEKGQYSFDVVSQYGNTSEWYIYKIRRKSDGVEFKIGDRVYWNWAFAKNKYFTIKSFNIIEDKLRFNTVEESGQNFIFELISKEYNLQHYKEPILTTEDGKELFSGDTFYCITEHYHIISGEFVSNYASKTFKYFSTEEAAEKYLNENKPMYSKKEVIDFGGYILRNLKGVMPMKLLFELWLREKGN